jgi:hypothetical protein
MKERLQEIRDRLPADGAVSGDAAVPATVHLADLIWLLTEVERLQGGLQKIANHRGDTPDDRDPNPCPACSAIRVYARSLLRGTESTISFT